MSKYKGLPEHITEEQFEAMYDLLCFFFHFNKCMQGK